MYEQLLTEAGLNRSEALIYELLLKEGTLTAGQINQKSPIKRGLVYKTLDDLVAKKLVEKQEKPGNVARFEARNPSELAQMINQKEQTVRRQKSVIDKLLPQLVSDYTLSAGRPVVRFFEGMDAIRLVGFDSLNAKSEIYQYIDTEAVDKYMSEINETYTERQNKLGKKKKSIVMNSEYNRQRFLKMELKNTQVRYIDFQIPKCGAVMQIYDDKISYLTVKKRDVIGFIIEDAAIASFHKSLFEYTWSTAAEKSELTMAPSD